VDLGERNAVVLYGSMTGTAKSFAAKLAAEAQRVRTPFVCVCCFGVVPPLDTTGQLFEINVRMCAFDEYEYEDELQKVSCFLSRFWVVYRCVLCGVLCLRVRVRVCLYVSMYL
jgi:hypothetical protein